MKSDTTVERGSVESDTTEWLNSVGSDIRAETGNDTIVETDSVEKWYKSKKQV